MKKNKPEIEPVDFPTYVSEHQCIEHNLINLSKDALDYHNKVIKHKK